MILCGIISIIAVKLFLHTFVTKYMTIGENDHLKTYRIKRMCVEIFILKMIV